MISSRSKIIPLRLSLKRMFVLVTLTIGIAMFTATCGGVTVTPLTGIENSTLTPNPTLAPTTPSTGTGNLPTITPVKDTPAPTIAVTQTPIPTATSLPQPTSASQSPTLPPTAVYPDQINFWPFTEGWDTNNGQLYWTSATGKRWQVSLPRGMDTTDLRGAFSLDPQQVWLVAVTSHVSGGAQTTTPVGLQFFHTTNAGKTWQTGASLPSTERYGRIPLTAHITFSDANNGWAVIDLRESMNSHPGELWRTTDGGQSWQKLKFSTAGLIRFITPEIGWTSVWCCTGAPSILYHSLDSGQNWVTQTVSIPQPYTASDASYEVPIFFDTQNGVLAVTFRASGGSQSSAIGLYNTHNGGQSWTLAMFVPDSVQDYSGQMVYQFLDINTWIIADQLKVYITRDAGKTYQAVVIHGLPAKSSFRAINFDDAENGRAVVDVTSCTGIKQCNNNSAIFQTADGGANWISK